MSTTRAPLLYQVNARIWLGEWSRRLGRRLRLDEIPDAALDRLRAGGFDWLWLMGVWRTGDRAAELARGSSALREEARALLPDLREEDIDSSCFAVTGYQVPEGLGGEEALAGLRRRLARRGIRLMLDFIPNHVGLDHPWVENRPEWLVHGTEAEAEAAPENYVARQVSGERRILAHGRDPYFPAWRDTLQLDYGNAAVGEAMAAELLSVAGRCDGVRCDMAMLVLPEVFERTWGRRAGEFWPRAIEVVRSMVPGFLFVAEVYWGLGPDLRRRGFDYCYAKELYDALRDARVAEAREELARALGEGMWQVRFLENHDERRAAAVFADGRHEAAAVVTFLSPGLRLVQEGQLEGRRVRVPVQLVRAPEELEDPALAGFYGRLLALLRAGWFGEGRWRWLPVWPVGEAESGAANLLAWAWEEGAGERRAVVVVNYASYRGRGYVEMAGAGGESLQGVWRVLLAEGRTGECEWISTGRGFRVDLPGWGVRVFEVNGMT